MSKAPKRKTIRPPFWEEACNDLMRRDRVLRKIIPKYGDAALESHGDAFTTLLRSVIGQQVSVKSADSIWTRLCESADTMTANHLITHSIEKLRTCGLSQRKAEYVHGISQAFLDKTIEPKKLAKLDDEAVIEQLCQLRGVGRWTAEMFLIFHLMRPDIAPIDDLGLVKGISLCYFSGEPVARAEAREMAQSWKPWSSVATWYLWRSLDPVPVAY